jgi:hypothetical protein
VAHVRSCRRSNCGSAATVCAAPKMTAAT